MALLLCRCTSHQQHSPAPDKDPAAHLVDTFGLVDLRMDPSRQHTIRVSTTEVQPDQHHLGIVAMVPSVGDLPAVSRWVDSIVKDKVKEFKEGVRDERVETDTALHMKIGWSMWMSPVNLYRTVGHLSIAIENRHGFTGTPSWYEYHIINFDLEKEKRIRLEDYFILDTSADTLALAGLVCRSVNCTEPADALQYLRNPAMFGTLKFAFDEEYVYFFFDKGELFDGGHTGSVRKKFIKSRLRPEYR